MKKGIYFLVILVGVIITLIFTSQNNRIKESKELTSKYKQSLMDVDIAFNKMSEQNGLGRAFIDFADDSVTLLRDKAFPIIGKKNLADHYLNKENNKTPLRWYPVKAEASPDGHLGYTFGNWEYHDVGKDGQKIDEYGNYVTIWKKQADGKWKYVLDGGSSTPPPELNK